METIFTDLGLGWTLSKILPYVLFIILGVFIFWLAQKRISSKKLKWISSLIILIPVGVYFIFNPIYEGDFSNSYTTLSNVPDSVEVTDGVLTVFAIPNCPFCRQSIDVLKTIKARTNNPRIDFKVVTSDSSMVANYIELSDGELSVSQETSIDASFDITSGRFPTFVFKTKEETRVWNNDAFGSRARDWVEEQISK